MGASTSERVKRSEAQQVLGFAGIGQGLLDDGWMGGVGDHVHHGMALPGALARKFSKAGTKWA